MKIALELDKNNIINGYIYMATEDYSRLEDSKFTIADLEIGDPEEINLHKTKYINGELVAMDDYTIEYKTEQEIKAHNQEIENKIAEYKQRLADSDYKAIKYAEGLLSVEEYEPIKLQRQEWRDKINELEEELK